MHSAEMNFRLHKVTHIPDIKKSSKYYDLLSHILPGETFKIECRDKNEAITMASCLKKERYHFDRTFKIVTRNRTEVYIQANPLPEDYVEEPKEGQGLGILL